MEIFCYTLVVSEEVQFYVTVSNEKLFLTTSKLDEERTGSSKEFTWAVCLQNIVLFGLSFMSNFDFEIKDSPIKKQLKLVLCRIKQFEKLGDVELSKNVLVLFLSEFQKLIATWFQFVESNQLEDEVFLIRNTIGLLCTFHHMFYHCSQK